jgi:hypothetical protein
MPRRATRAASAVSMLLRHAVATGQVPHWSLANGIPEGPYQLSVLLSEDLEMRLT